jgi:hypothetical protein
MAAIVTSQHAKATRLTGVASGRATARDTVRRAIGYAAAAVLICAVGATVAQLVAEILSFPAPLAGAAIALTAVALLHWLRRHLDIQPGHRYGLARTRRVSSDRRARI